MLEPYEISPEPPTPDLPGRVVVRETVEDVMSAVASDLFAQAVACVRAFGDFHLAVSACRTVEPLYTRLMIDPLYRSLPWHKTHLWLVADGPDESGRFPGADMLEELVGEHADIPRDQFHLVGASGEDAATDYERRIREHLQWREKGHDRLDCVILSPADRDRLIHPDGEGDLVRAVIEGGRSRGVALTGPFVRASRFVGVVGVDASHRDAVRAMIADPDGTSRDLGPLGGELRWYLASPAAEE